MRARTVLPALALVVAAVVVTAWLRGPARVASDEAAPQFNGLVMSVDGQLPAEGEDAVAHNLWLCFDQATDGIDNDGDSTVDNEAPTCSANGEGELLLDEVIFTGPDCDTRNDDDDGDGRPVSNDANSVDYRPECPTPTLQDYISDLVDKDGGELPEGLGALEFQIKFDHKIFDISITGSSEWVAPGRFANCSMMIVTENDIRFGCVTTGSAPGLYQTFGEKVATISVKPEADLILRLRPTKDNGVVRRLLEDNCQVADIYGDIFPNTNAGLTPDCTDIVITARRLEGDTDADCDVDLADAQRIAFRYGSFFGHLFYDQNYDLEPWPTADFDIDIKDLQFVFGRVGSTCAAPIPDTQDPVPEGSLGLP